MFQTKVSIFRLLQTVLYILFVLLFDLLCFLQIFRKLCFSLNYRSSSRCFRIVLIDIYLPCLAVCIRFMSLNPFICQVKKMLSTVIAVSVILLNGSQCKGSIYATILLDLFEFPSNISFDEPPRLLTLLPFEQHFQITQLQYLSIFIIVYLFHWFKVLLIPSARSRSIL
jgi:hypothetical protein